MANTSSNSPTRSLADRFVGNQNNPNLVEALRRQPLVQGDSDIAANLANHVSVDGLAAKDILINQGEPDDDLFFILAGRVSVTVNGREVAIRTANQHVGEMCIVDPSGCRSATVTALEDTVIAKIGEPFFLTLAQAKPELWKRIAVELCVRLRQRGSLIQAPNPRPVLFVGSSAESLPVARALVTELRHEDWLVRPWTSGVFQAGNTTIDDLAGQVATSDFAVMVFTPDDQVISRKGDWEAPRDNVVFELGLFMGALTRQRTFILKPMNVDLKIPSDLYGINTLEFKPGRAEELSATVVPACNELRIIINRLGVR